jgi:nitrate/nitrite-specific signal transduction histidine kinase
VHDDGCGFDPANVPAEHLGLSIMQERANSIGADLTVDSRPGNGTRIAVVWEADQASERANESNAQDHFSPDT